MQHLGVFESVGSESNIFKLPVVVALCVVNSKDTVLLLDGPLDWKGREEG